MLAALNSYVPVLIRKQVAESPEPLKAPIFRSIQAAVLLADISGFTSLTERLTRDDPRGVEKISSGLNDYFGLGIDIIRQYGGDVVKFAGDAVLAIWPAGATARLQDAVLPAAGCALEAHRALHGYLTTEGIPLTFRTGISSGTVQTVHLGGMFGRWELLVTGEAVNQVSLATQVASPGAIALTPQA